VGGLTGRSFLFWVQLVGKEEGPSEEPMDEEKFWKRFFGAVDRLVGVGCVSRLWNWRSGVMG
jgi:hypothetical protein